MKPKQGGKRKGAGRKPAPYKTVTVSFRVKEQDKERVVNAVKKELKKTAS